MKKSIEILKNKLKDKNISKNIICPSAKKIIVDLNIDITNQIEIIDERSAGYVATGMCAEAKEPICVWCADNDSYRNLAPALTEAYYKKLPLLIIALNCSDLINQTINPNDTIRYYANNTCYNRIGTEEEIDFAIKLLYANIKGPVYLSITEYREHIVYPPKTEATHKDASAIAKMIPPAACVHIGSDVGFKCQDTTNVVFRHDHCTHDGNLSMLIGSSIVKKNQLHVGIFTNEEIAYDLNMLGNRHIINNLIIICLCNSEESSALKNVANRFAWKQIDCPYTHIEGLKDILCIGENPKFINVVL